MKLKERLIDATKKAAEYYNGGSDVNSAVIKAAKDYSFNKDQTDRLTEMFNTALTLHEFKKNASDRTPEFDLADKNKVAHGIFAEEKKAEAVRYYDYSFYDAPAVNKISTANFEKAAEAVDEPKDTTHDILKSAELARQASDLARETEEQIRARMITDVYKVAEHVNGRYDSDMYSRLKSACSDCGVILSNLEKIIRPEFSKVAASDDDIIDDSDIFEDEDVIKNLKKMMGDLNEFHMTSITMSKKSEDLFNSVIPKKEKDVFGDMLRKSAQASGIREYLLPGSKSNIDIANKVRIDSNTKKTNRASEADNNMVRSALITDLITTDPIISEADPEDVARAYSTIVNIAPEVSMEKEIVRAMLRQSINSVALSPYDAKTYVDLNRAMTPSQNKYTVAS